MTTAFGAATGQGWAQIADLVIAFVLSLLIGTERELRHKAAGLGTYTLVGLGSALFVLVSKYGFSDVLGDHVALDPSRVAAQIVTGVGFIGGGLIFVRRDAVRGLTTAASVWLTAAVGAAAGAGLPVLAAVSTALYFLVLHGLRPLTSWVRGRSRPGVGLRVTYLDHRGLLREIVNVSTGHGFAISDLTSVRVTPGEPAADGERDLRRDRREGEAQHPAETVEVTMALAGRGDVNQLVSALTEIKGVVAVRTGAATLEE